MDPTACLAGLLGEFSSIRHETDCTARDEAISRLNVLSRWMEANGAPPDVDAAISTYQSRITRGTP